MALNNGFVRVRSLFGGLLMVATCLFTSANASDLRDIVPDSPRDRDELISKLAQTRLGIVTGNPGGTYIQLGNELSSLLSSAYEDGLRLIVSVGSGSLGNLRDLLFLEHTDLALVQADVLDFIAETNPNDYAYMRDRISYVSRFHPEVIHVLARNDPSIDIDGDGVEPEELDGKVISVGSAGGGSQITAEILFENVLGISPIFQNHSEAWAMADLASSAPSIDAMIYVAGRGSERFKGLPDNIFDGFEQNKVTFVQFDRDPPTRYRYYSRTKLSDIDYPELIRPGESLSLWSVPAVLAVYNWKPERGGMHLYRYQRTKNFVEAFFDASGKLADGRFNQNWCDIDIGADVSGWERYEPAQTWLAKNGSRDTRICDNDETGENDDASCQKQAEMEVEESGVDPESRFADVIRAAALEKCQ